MRQIIQAVHDHIVQFKVPLPFPLRWVNSYIVRGREGYTIIDPGLHTEEAERLWEEVMLELGIGASDIERIVLTHHHPDHYGMAGWLQARSSGHSPVLLSHEGKGLAGSLWGEGEMMTERMYQDFRTNGMDLTTADAMIPHMKGFIPLVSPQPDVSIIRDGEQVSIGDRTYLAIHTPGHATGHLCFYNEATREIFCGDQVLPQITPNVSLLPGGDPDPLASFLDSLERVGKLQVSLAMPGHRDPFSSFTERSEEIVRHHEARLLQIRGLLSEPMTAFQMCRKLFGDKLSIHQLRFAMGETMAHLVYLEQRGFVKTSMNHEGVVHYAKSH
jgi:glyoxylase-like metal-dependent hydrolase (beta-lactamase superfamily II)